MPPRCPRVSAVDLCRFAARGRHPASEAARRPEAELPVTPSRPDSATEVRPPDGEFEPPEEPRADEASDGRPARGRKRKARGLRLPDRPGVILEDVDRLEERRQRHRKKGLPDGLEGTPEDPRLWRRMSSYARPFAPALGVAVLLSFVAMAAKVAYLFVLKGLLQPFFETQMQVDPGEAWGGWARRLAESNPDGWLETLRVQLEFTLHALGTGLRVSPPLEQLRTTALLMVALVIFEQANKYGQKLLMRRVSLRVVQRVREDLFDRLLTLSLRFFNVNHSGKLLSRITNDLNRLGNLLTDVMVNVLTDVFTVFGMLWVVWSEGGTAVIVALGLACITFIPVQQLARRIRSKEGQNQRKMSRVFLSLAESLSSQKVVKAFGAEQHERERFRAANERFTEGRMKSTELKARTDPIVETLGAIAVAFFMYLGGVRVVADEWAGPAFFTVVYALVMCVGSLRRLSDTSTKLQGGLSSADRVATLLYSEPEIVDAPDAVSLPGFADGIEFDGVWYGHLPDQPVIRDVSFRLPKGGTLALVGHTGSGKSTVADLVARFYDVDKGRVLVDGHDVRGLTIDSLRAQFAWVTQETVLFDGTIASNIAYAIPEASREDIERAAKAAFAHDFIMAFPQGYETPVGERGTTLSGGERQRIAIARALLRDAPILLLDEATSALDTKSERLVQEAIDRLKEGRTTLVIAHRLSTIREADEILVLDKGAIVERGTHDELVALGGTYAQLVAMQGEGAPIRED